MTSRSGQPVVLAANTSRRPRRIEFDDVFINEDKIQDILHSHPGVLPIDDVSPSSGPLISLGREIASGRGPIDNLFLSPRGELTLVEAKLWRNPESRRKVVAQVLDYAAGLSKYSYEDLDRIVAAKNDGQSMWELVVSAGDGHASTEAQFIDTVTRNLRSGRMLLLIVGDGIREDVEDLAEIVGGRPDSRFHLELVELQLYEFDDGEQLVIPSVVGRTREVVRAVVDVRTDNSGQVQVTVEPQEAESDNEARSSMRSLDEFSERAAAEDPEWAEHVRRLVEWWEERGGQWSLNQDSVSFSYRYRHAPRQLAKVAVVYVYGTAEFHNRRLSVGLGLFDQDELRSDLKARGFGGKDRVTFDSEGIGEMWPTLTRTLDDIIGVLDEASQSDQPPPPNRLPQGDG